MSATLAAANAISTRPELALVRLLGRLSSTIRGIPVATYTARPAPHLSGSIGEHVRHCVDHVAAFTAGVLQAEFTYDHRVRGTDVEIDPGSAAAEIARLSQVIDGLSAFPPTRPVSVNVLLERDGMRVLARSSLARELAFVVQHTIHHAAIISLLLDRLGISVDDDPGLAPATPKRLSPPS